MIYLKPENDGGMEGHQAIGILQRVSEYLKANDVHDGEEGEMASELDHLAESLEGVEE